LIFEYSLVLIAVYLGGCFALAWSTIRPKVARHTATPASYRLAFERVSFRSADNTRLAGWLIPASSPARGLVILCHGVDSHAMEMLWPASVFNRYGLSTLIFDFRGRGESDAALCTIGYRETDDLLAAVKYVRSRPDTKALPIGVYGMSEGAAVAIMGAGRCEDIRAVVAESPFARLDRAVDNHYRSAFGSAGMLLAAPVRWIGEAMIRRKCRQVSPMDEIAGIAPRPVLLIQCEEDRLCPPDETKTLIRTAGEPTELWNVPAAGHCGAGDVAGEEFERRVSSFFLRSLKR
jgi:uncharacterized protein